MKANFTIKVISFTEIHELPGSWSSENFKEVLRAADFEDWDEIDENELKEYAIMSLQEFDPDEAAELILKYKLQNRLSQGQIQNIAHEMQEDKIWEEYTDIHLHKDLYTCTVILKWAFPNKFPETDAVKCSIEVCSRDNESLLQLDKTGLTRLLADGMDDHAVINRLFENQLKGKPFPEADGIIWQFEVTGEANKAMITVYSSDYWLHGMDDVDQYTSTLICDATPIKP